jgi:hypothetical protein
MSKMTGFAHTYWNDLCGYVYINHESLYSLMIFNKYLLFVSYFKIILYN